jgi:hypothetical protein
MNVGAAQIDVTPPPGCDLSGFAARVQPSIGVLDPIFARCVHLEEGGEQFLWAHVDVLGLDGTFLSAFRQWASETLNLLDEQVLLSTTHTHSAPATLSLLACGDVSAVFLNSLQSKLRKCALDARANAKTAEMCVAQADVELAIDRRGFASAHTDPRLGAIGWRNPSGDFLATVINYPMHPVTLGAENRLISADWCGRAAAKLSGALPGAPVVLVTNGACGNLNPPVRGDDPVLIDQLGGTLADAISQRLIRGDSVSSVLRVHRELVDLPLESCNAAAIDRLADQQLTKDLPDPQWRRCYHAVIEQWRQARKREIASGGGASAVIELQAVRVGAVIILAITGEIFSHFTQQLRKRTGWDVMVVGYANGAFGYVPVDAAYDEGGYEPDVAHFFYNSFRAARGGMEMLVDRAAAVVNSVA